MNSCILGAFYTKSYKKLNQKAQHLEITTFTMGIRHKIVLICKNLFLKRNLCVIFTTKDKFREDRVKEEIQTFLNMYDT